MKTHLTSKISNNRDGQTSTKEKEKKKRIVKIYHYRDSHTRKNPISSKFQKRKVLIDVSGSQMRETIEKRPRNFYFSRHCCEK